MNNEHVLQLNFQSAYVVLYFIYVGSMECTSIYTFIIWCTRMLLFILMIKGVVDQQRCPILYLTSSKKVGGRDKKKCKSMQFPRGPVEYPPAAGGNIFIKATCVFGPFCGTFMS